MLYPFDMKSNDDSSCVIPDGIYSRSEESTHFSSSSGLPMSLAIRKRLCSVLLSFSWYSL